MNDYTKTIIDNIHPMYKGWKKAEGAARVNSWLQLLEQQGGRMDDTVKQFLKWLPQPAMLEGFILEVEIAAEMIQAMPDWTFSSERMDGIAQFPCDITAERDGYRIDIQCKRLRNFINEAFTEDFQGWVETNYKTHEPGLILELEATTGANEATFKSLRSWMEVNIHQFLPGITLDYDDGNGKVRIGVTERSCCGITVGSVWSPSPTFGIALAVDEDSARKKTVNRIREAKTTFSALPSAHHFNLVAVQFPRMSFVEDDTIANALYGPEVISIADGRTEVRRKYDGPFALGQFAYCSGVLFRESGSMDSASMAIIPNRHFFQPTVDLFRQFPCFRPLVDTSNGRSLFEDWPYTKEK